MDVSSLAVVISNILLCIVTMILVVVTFTAITKEDHQHEETMLKAMESVDRKASHPVDGIPPQEP